MTREDYEIAREVRNIIEEMLQVKSKDLLEFCSQRDNLKMYMGIEFYNKWFKEALEI